jgi:plasmid stabilization system protein ParE
MPRAQEDVLSIISWISNRSLQGARAWYDAYEKMLHRLAEQPLACGCAPEAAALNRDLRQAMFKTRHGNTYRAIFLIEEKTVYVLRVRGAGQPPLKSVDI